MAWSNEEEQQLVQLREQGVSPKKIAEMLGKKPSTVRNKLSRMGLVNLTRFTEEEIQYIKDNYTGLNLREIARVLGREKNYHNVCRVARRLGLTDNARPIKKEKQLGLFPESRAKYFSEEDRREGISRNMKQWHEENPHPKGMLGKTHSDEFRREQSERLKRRWKNPNDKMNSESNQLRRSIQQSQRMVQRIQENNGNNYSNARGGKREDLGFYVRSRWEANYARYLNFLKEQGSIRDWEYEVDTFWFENIKRGTRSYTPDFKVWLDDTRYEYHEVKGYMDQKSKTKLKRMAKYYPAEKIVIIGNEEYQEIKSKLSRLIEHWED